MDAQNTNTITPDFRISRPLWLLVLLVALFGSLYLYGNRFEYSALQSGTSSLPVRFNRYSGTTEVMGKGGWAPASTLYESTP